MTPRSAMERLLAYPPTLPLVHVDHSHRVSRMATGECVSVHTSKPIQAEDPLLQRNRALDGVTEASVVDAVFDNFEDAAETSGWEDWNPLRAIFKSTPKKPEYIGLDGIKDYFMHEEGYEVPDDVHNSRADEQLARYFGAAIAAGVAKALYDDKFLHLTTAERRKLKMIQNRIDNDRDTLYQELGSWKEPWMPSWVKKQVRSKKWREFYGQKLKQGAKYLVANAKKPA